MANASGRRVLFIVLDGADLLYIRRWLDAGELPHLAALIKQGALMPLASTISNYTTVAWPALFTGQNPGKTGITDILLRKRGSHDVIPGEFRGVQVEPFWIYLGERGLRSLVMNVPVTYPPRPLHGLLISGLGTPAQAHDYAWPENVKEQLDRGKYPERMLQAQHHLATWSSTHRQHLSRASYLKACDALSHHQTDYAERLLAEQAWDVAFIGYHLTDFVNHFTADSTTHLEVYRMADEMVGHLVAQAGEDATVILASDHGSMVSGRCIGLARIFLDAGLIAFEPRVAPEVLPWILSATLPGILSSPTVLKAFERIWKGLPKWVQRLLSWLPLKLRPGWAHFYSNIDWSRTQAYVLNAAKTVYINRSDVLPGGVVDPGPEYETLRTKIIDILEAIRDPGTQAQVFRVHRTEDVWHGPHTDAEAPDLLLSLVEERYFLQQADPRGRTFWDEDEETIGGTHRTDGVLLLKGEGIREGVILPRADILDVVPTLLYLMGVPLPLELDGQPIRHAIRPDYLEQHPVAVASHARPGTYQPNEAAYTEEDLQSVLERLRGLGYIE